MVRRQLLVLYDELMFRLFAFVIVSLHKVCACSHLLHWFVCSKDRNVDKWVWCYSLQPPCWHVCACIMLYNSIQTLKLN